MWTNMLKFHVYDSARTTILYRIGTLPFFISAPSAEFIPDSEHFDFLSDFIITFFTDMFIDLGRHRNPVRHRRTFVWQII